MADSVIPADTEGIESTIASNRRPLCAVFLFWRKLGVSEVRGRHPKPAPVPFLDVPVGRHIGASGEAHYREWQQQYDRSRPSSSERGYGPYWRKRRAEFLETHPICCVDGCGQNATVADHFSTSVAEGRRRGWSWEQIHADAKLRPMCQRHHNSRTSRDQGWGKSQL